MRVLLIDDEPPARRKLRHMLEAEPDVEIVGEACSEAQAVRMLDDLKPDLALLDIQLPDGSGFDVVQKMQQRKSLQIIFVTAHDDFAIKAFEIQALDYLLKPVERTRFAQAIDRARQALRNGGSQDWPSRLQELVASLRSGDQPCKRLLIQERGRSILLEVEKIDWIESARNYACIHSGPHTHVARLTLEALESKLDGSIFRRINRSEIVNVHQIAELRPAFRGDQKVILKNGTELGWSRRYRAFPLSDLERF